MNPKKIIELSNNFEKNPLYTIKDFSKDAGISLAEAMEYLKESEIINNVGIKLEEDFVIESYKTSLRKFTNNGLFEMIVLAIIDTFNYLKSILKKFQDYVEVILKSLMKIFYFAIAQIKIMIV